MTEAPLRQRRAAILDRDGTLIVDQHYLSRPDQVELLPGVAEGLRRLRSAGYLLVVITNQSGIGRGYFSESDFEAATARLDSLLAQQGVKLDATYHCPHRPEDDCGCRKPRTDLLLRAASDLGFDVAHSVVIGDKESDAEMGIEVGGRAVLIRPASETAPHLATRADHVASDFPSAVEHVLNVLEAF